MPLDFPGHVPQGDEMFVLKITLGQGMRTPSDVLAAIFRSINEYEAGAGGSPTPFHVRPGIPQGHIHTVDGVHVGEWAVTT